MTRIPCQADPELWFQKDPNPARLKCILDCPPAAQQVCAQAALDGCNRFGVWAGVTLPGSSPRQRARLDSARRLLRKIADGVPPAQLKYNRTLLRQYTARRKERNLSICA